MSLACRLTDDVIGEVIGSYRVKRALGQGGMGAVYVAEHTLIGRRAAIKVLLPSLSRQPEMVTRFFNEARAATSIPDAGIVQVYDFGYHTDGAAFIVMELLDGEPLDRRLQRLGRLPSVDALRIARQIATTLAAAHACGIVHRDLKPENVFLVRDTAVAGGERVKILDFGIAKLTGDANATSTTQIGAIMGTPLYMSPEQCRGAGEVDHRSDIYALGCVLYHLLVGRPPFVGEGLGEILAMQLYEQAPPPSVVLPFVDVALDPLVMWCLAKSAGERPADMNAVAAEIERHLLSAAAAVPSVRTDLASASQRWQVGAVVSRTPTTLGGSAGVAATTPPPPPHQRRWQRAAITGALALVLALAATAVVTARSGDSSTAAPALAPTAADPGSSTEIAPAAATPPPPTPSAIDAGLADSLDDAAAPPPPDARRHHPARVKPTSENPRSLPPDPGVPAGMDDPCRMDEQGNVIDRHRCKE